MKQITIAIFQQNLKKLVVILKKNHLFKKKLKKIVENTNYSGSYTTREKSQSILINEQNKEIMVPLTCRGFSLNEISSDEEIVQNIKVSYHEKINEITAFYDEKIRIIEGRFFKNNEKKRYFIIFLF